MGQARQGPKGERQQRPARFGRWPRRTRSDDRSSHAAPPPPPPPIDTTPFALLPSGFGLAPLPNTDWYDSLLSTAPFQDADSLDARVARCRAAPGCVAVSSNPGSSQSQLKCAARDEDRIIRPNYTAAVVMQNATLCPRAAVVVPARVENRCDSRKLVAGGSKPARPLRRQWLRRSMDRSPGRSTQP